MSPSRRMFLGTTLAAAVPLTLDVRSLAVSQPVPSDTDRVLEHVARELAAIHARIRRTGGARGEDVRSIAANLRVLVAADSSLDARVAHALEIINARGADAFFAAPLPPEAVAALRRELRRYGVNAPVPDLHTFPFEFRDKLLAALAGQGAAKVILASAAQLETISPALDAMRGGIVRVQLTSSACCDLWWNAFIMAAVAVAVGVSCAICGVQLSLAAAALYATYEMNCTGSLACF